MRPDKVVEADRPHRSWLDGSYSLPPASGFAHPADVGRQVFCSIRQSMPSSKLPRCAGLITTVRSAADGQMKRPHSSFFAGYEPRGLPVALPALSCLGLDSNRNNRPFADIRPGLIPVISPACGTARHASIELAPVVPRSSGQPDTQVSGIGLDAVLMIDQADRVFRGLMV